LGYIEERLVALDYAGASDDLLPEPVQALAGGGAHLFSQWPNPEVPILGREFTQSGTGTAGSSTSACPGGGYSRGTIPRNNVEAAISSASTCRTDLSCRSLLGTTLPG
jgi:hypothetical protein